MENFWTEEREDALVQLWQKKPALYDISSKDIKVIKKIASLRTQYSRYAKLPPSGNAGRRTSRQEWILNHLSFLGPHVRKRPSVSNINAEEGSEDQGETSDTEDNPSTSACSSSMTPEVIQLQDDTDEEFDESPPAKTTKATKNSTGMIKGERKVKNREAEEMALLKALVNSLTKEDSEEDDIAVFCNHLKRELRQIKNPQVLLLLQNQIQQATFHVRMGLFDGKVSPGNVPPHPQQDAQPLQPPHLQHQQPQHTQKQQDIQKFPTRRAGWTNQCKQEFDY
uniref:uncharacterized protein isoform X2 n=1 Tax=Myxine glutinosa TaxID=7769 RepID=UPI00358F6736